MATNSITDLSSDKHDQERLFCACVLSAPDIAVRDCSWLPESAFTDQKLGRFWSDVKQNGDGIKAANVHGLTTELAGWLNKTPSVTTPDVYAKGIAEHKYFIDVLANNTELARAALNRDAVKVKQVLDDLQASDISKPIIKHDSIALHKELGEVLDGSSSPYVKTFISTVDKVLGGFYGGDLITFAGRPGFGKTCAAMVFGRNVSFSGKKVDFFSLEMKRIQLWGRSVSGHAGENWRDVRIGEVDERGKTKIRDISEKMMLKMGSNFVVYDDIFTVDGIMQACMHDKPDFVIVDHLGEIDWHDKSASEVQWYGDATKFLRMHIAKRLNVPVLMLHQLSRAVEDRTGNKRPILKDLKWSGEIEQRSDVVIFIYREDMYLDNIESTIVPVELLVRKNRQGVAKATMMVEYDLEKQDMKAWIGEY